ncbi:hypothetical protein GCM10010517_63550 [Streptosporangium fragile]|uniref:GH29D-like beta-sandwich domain-containing protein n=1 Tax=Streptosporangium fragile TaxID=46186 RepID=A0ABN3W681_9ACTN
MDLPPATGVTARLAALAAALLLPLGTAAPVSAGAAATAPAAHTVTIDPGSVVQRGFRGVGVNIIPGNLMEGSTQYGYDEADWEMDRKRILTIKPKIARVWFQIDWMEPEKGRYTWDSDRMLAFYKYLDVLKEVGTEVELNFGWKVGEKVHDWFVIPGVDPYISAPADLDAYAASASAALEELIRNRGYDNVKYLTFYNEPNGSWDFEAPGDQKAYYAAMVARTGDRLKADGLRDLVEIWAPEEVDHTWTQYMAANASEHIDGYGFHVYGASYEHLSAEIASRRQAAGTKPVHMTEFGWSDPLTSGWDSGFANHVIKAANEGLTSALVWQMTGVHTKDPDGDTNGTYTLWDSLLLGLEPSRSFYSAGLLMRYVPERSDVIAVDTGSPDLRAAAFRTEDGQWTIVLESKAGAAKNVTFDFGGRHIGRTFHRFVYQDDVARTGHALLPAASGAFRAGTSFTDPGIGAGYTVAVYTTAPPQTQVKVTPLTAQVTSGKALKLNASVLDNRAGVTWSVAGAGNGRVTPGGVFHAPVVTTQRTVAVKATSRKDPDGHGVALVTVVPASRKDTVEVPALSLEDGVYDSAEAVSITTATPGATIHYTTDGSVPTTASPVYVRPIILKEAATTRVRALAVRSGMKDSGLADGVYKILQISSAPDGYRFCMYEGGRCHFEGEASVAFGADGLFTYKTFTDGVECTAGNFGGDPIPGVDKRCYVNPEIPEETPLVTVYNAGFEKPATATARPGPFTNGWTFNSRAGVQNNAGPFGAPAAPDGVQTAYLKTDGGVSGRFSQEINFRPGTYSMTFKAAKRGFGGLQKFDVYFDDTVIGTYIANSGTYLTYQTASFETDGGRHTVAFVATTTTGDNTAFIDAVRIGLPRPPEAPSLINTGFESPPTPGIKPGPMTDGWTFNSRAGVQRNGSQFGAATAPEGVQTAYLQTRDGVPGTFTQEMAFSAGTYTLSFRAARRQGFGGLQTFTVSFDDKVIGTYTPSTAEFAPFTTESFTATAGTHAITFTATTTTGDNTAFIDDAKLNLVTP